MSIVGADRGLRVDDGWGAGAVQAAVTSINRSSVTVFSLRLQLGSTHWTHKNRIEGVGCAGQDAGGVETLWS